MRASIGWGGQFISQIGSQGCFHIIFDRKLINNRRIFIITIISKQIFERVDFSLNAGDLRFGFTFISFGCIGKCLGVSKRGFDFCQRLLCIGKNGLGLNKSSA